MSAFLVTAKHFATLVAQIVHVRQNERLFERWINECKNLIILGKVVEFEVSLAEKIKNFNSETKYQTEKFSLLAEVLINANYQGISDRYNNATMNDDYKKSITLVSAKNIQHSVDNNLHPIFYLKSCDCLSYQCTSAKDYDKSFAALFLKEAPQFIIQNSKEYHQYDWGIS